METNTNKKLYIAPEITEIALDNEISLALESAPSAIPPAGPFETSQNREVFKDNPFDKA